MLSTFAAYVLDSQRHALCQQSVPVPLEGKAYQVLVSLVPHALPVGCRSILEAHLP